VKNFKNPLEKYNKTGGCIFGICGGFQILGEFVDDPEGLEGNPGITKALGLLPIQTILKSPKTTTISEFTWAKAKGKGYEIHMGATKIIDGTPLLEINSRNSLSCTDSDGCLADNNQVAGTYIHGFFDSSQVLSKWLGWAGITIKNSFEDMNSTKEKNYTLLKEHFETYIDIAPLL
jgi:adenosylcobyric acid synthase